MDAKIDRLIRNSFKSISSQLIYKLPKRKIIALQGRNQANTTLTECPKFTSLMLRRTDSRCLLGRHTEKESAPGLQACMWSRRSTGHTQTEERATE